MDRISLHKIIKSFVLPKYKWINDYEITFYYDSPIEKYSVIYYTVSPDISDKEDEVMEVENLTRNLFKMLGPESYQWFIDVEFYFKAKYNYGI
jgi:hypothetical protein